MDGIARIRDLRLRILGSQAVLGCLHLQRRVIRPQRQCLLEIGLGLVNRAGFLIDQPTAVPENSILRLESKGRVQIRQRLGELLLLEIRTPAVQINDRIARI